MSWHVSDSSIGKGMRNIIFHETKRERKFYEDKKQKALRYLDHTKEEILDSTISEYRILRKLTALRRLVNDI